MSGPFGSSQWMYASGGFYGFPIEQSLRFNDNDSAYLSRTPASAGNRKTWTWSGWVKPCNTNVEKNLLSVRSGTSYPHMLFWIEDSNSSTRLRILEQTNVSNLINVETTASLRDSSAWYHIVATVDTTQATASDRVKLYINGVQQTALSLTEYPSLNADLVTNSTTPHAIGRRTTNGGANIYSDKYLAEVNFIDGQALDPTSFGEFKSGVWIPKDPSGLTYGTNGFRLSFQNDTVSEGFNTVTWTGNSSTQSLNGVGFSPDFVWIKSRTNASQHVLTDTIRGATKTLISNATDAEATFTGDLTSFNADGFSVGSNSRVNGSGDNIVAWCWDAGSGSPVSNTDGSITSTVKANAAYGMSVISYTGNGTAGATVGHGLSSAPEMIIIKDRDAVKNWIVYHVSNGNDYSLYLNDTSAKIGPTDHWNYTTPTSSVFTLGNYSHVNTTDNYIAYAFHSVTGYSKVGSWTGTGSGLSVTTGFKPAFVLLKNASDGTASWIIFDGTRNTSDPRDLRLDPNASDAESTFSNAMDFDANGFTINSSGLSQSGDTYIYIAFADTRDNAFWRDQSGNGNDWQPNNLTYQDSLPDSTTGNNFAVLNPLENTAGYLTYSEGNLRASIGAFDKVAHATMAMPPSGKWYFEYLSTSTSAASVVGLSDKTVSQSSGTGFSGGTFALSNTVSNNVICGVAFDADALEVKFYLNGSLDKTTSSLSSVTWFAAAYLNDTNGVFNFGQDSSFAGNKPAQGNTDDNGIGDFYYAPPSGYLALCTANLPDPVIDPAQDDVPSDYFNTVLYTGNGSTQSVTVGWQPDFTWIKSRTNGGRWHALFDAVRGTEKRLFSNDTSAEDTTANTLTSFDSDGFTLGSQAGQNGSGDSFVSWNWLAGNGTSSNTDGSITSTVSVNQKAGFSVVSYTGNGTSGATVGHGLGATPKMVIVKGRQESFDWKIYHANLTSGRSLRFTTAAEGVDANYIGSPSSSIFTCIGTDSVNASAKTYIAYCFAEVEGYSKFGSYTGNGSTDGPFVYTGFRPAFVMVKRTDAAGSWVMLDTQRSTYNVVDDTLWANLSSAEATYTWMDFLSNGFKLRDASNGLNNSGGSYIYMSFASNPFKFSTAR